MNCKVMGIVNVTPDSFSDGGQFFKPSEAIRRARNLIAEGADIIDLGAESTRPGSIPLEWEEEWSRLEPVLAGLLGGEETRGERRALIAISIDTYHPETAERALKLGARMINCVSAESAPEMFDICEKYAADLVIPASSQGSVPSFTGSVPSFTGSVPSISLGSVPSFTGSVPSIWLDPMIGFGTTREEDLALLKSVPELAKKGRVVVGVSRKRIVRRLSGEYGVGKLLGGSVALALWCAAHGASMVRVHDVKETVEALTAWSALD